MRENWCILTGMYNPWPDEGGTYDVIGPFDSEAAAWEWLPQAGWIMDEFGWRKGDKGADAYPMIEPEGMGE